jgi:hypothetical protein
VSRTIVFSTPPPPPLQEKPEPYGRVGEDEGWSNMGMKKNLGEEVLQITQVTYSFPLIN